MRIETNETLILRMYSSRMKNRKIDVNCSDRLVIPSKETKHNDYFSDRLVIPSKETKHNDYFSDRLVIPSKETEHDGTVMSVPNKTFSEQGTGK